MAELLYDFIVFLGTSWPVIYKILESGRHQSARLTGQKRKVPKTRRRSQMESYAPHGLALKLLVMAYAYRIICVRDLS
jgi:hypothetical protein